jgi:hypothetical protein
VSKSTSGAPNRPDNSLFVFCSTFGQKKVKNGQKWQNQCPENGKQMVNKHRIVDGFARPKTSNGEKIDWFGFIACFLST